jgi:hypothetical protein
MVQQSGRRGLIQKRSRATTEVPPVRNRAMAARAAQVLLAGPERRSGQLDLLLCHRARGA